MKRDVRIKIDFVVTVDDDGTGIPSVARDLEQVAKIVIPDAVHLHPNWKISANLTRESSLAARRAAKGDPNS